MRKSFVLLLLIMATACNDGGSGITSKVDTASVKAVLTDAWHILDNNIQIDEIKVLDVDTITEQQRLTEKSSFLFEKLKQYVDSLEWAKSNIATQISLNKTNEEYKLGLDSGKIYLGMFEKDLEDLSKRRQAVHDRWESTRSAIANADAKLPAGYLIQCIYRVQSKEMSKTDSSSIYLDKDFKALPKEAFFH